MKNYAIEVFFDEQFDHYVRQLWQLCDEQKLSSFMNNVVGTEPHIALAVYENCKLDDIIKLFQSLVARELYQFPLLFDAISAFQVTNVSYLQPNTTHEFTKLMYDVHQHFKAIDSHCSPFYHPTHWFPHCTIAKNNNKESLLKTLNFVLNHFSPQRAVVTRIALVEIEYDVGQVICRNVAEHKLIPN